MPLTDDEKTELALFLDTAVKEAVEQAVTERLPTIATTVAETIIATQKAQRSKAIKEGIAKSTHHRATGMEDEPFFLHSVESHHAKYDRWPTEADLIQRLKYRMDKEQQDLHRDRLLVQGKIKWQPYDEARDRDDPSRLMLVPEPEQETQSEKVQKTMRDNGVDPAPFLA
jgi:hypothetical protein